MVASLALVAGLGFSSQLANAAQVAGDAYNLTVLGAPAGSVGWSLGGPGGFAARSDSLSYDSFFALPDGQYSYEVIGTLSGRAVSALDYKATLDNGRDASSRGAMQQPTGTVFSGYFRIEGGVVVPQNSGLVEE